MRAIDIRWRLRHMDERWDYRESLIMPITSQFSFFMAAGSANGWSRGQSGSLLISLVSADAEEWIRKQVEPVGAIEAVKLRLTNCSRT